MRSERWIAGAVIASAGLLGATSASAGGPRFVTGPSYTVGGGVPMVFYTSAPLYYTDPGALNANVSHAQADAMVAAAAAPWNVPTSSLILRQGGELAEHVSSANVYFDGSEMVFPADVSPSNSANIQIAVIYDTDGSVIDTLLGEGASDPSGCRETGVVESVDWIGIGGKIRHAMLILNGRCVGSTPQQLLQMQYQLERAFGRVIGIAWSQLNDNIFTGATPATPSEIDYWPIMHPIDVLCSSYTYQCMTNPFQLRMDDLDALAMLYPVTPANIQAGQILSTANALNLSGSVSFPTGQGMDWVNVTATRQMAGRNTADPWQIVSGVSGYKFQQIGGNPITGSVDNVETTGDGWGPDEGGFVMPRVADPSVENVYMRTEAIDPLYTGEYAIAPYQRPPVTPSGSSVFLADWSGVAGQGGFFTATAWDASSSCAPGNDGTQRAPAASDASGWWKGLLCPLGHSSWWNVQVKAGSSWTVEITALDETGAATTAKAQPLIGVWNVGDSGLPTVASETVSMNSMAPGVTQLWMPASATPGNYMFAVADQYGAGRPDFGYSARVLYAASVTPAAVSTGGGKIVIDGEGFRQGNQVSVNGVPATVVSWSANEIVATVPSMAATGVSLAVPVDVMVTDVATGGETDIANGFVYSDVQPDVMSLLSQPASLETGMTAAAPFTVQLMNSDGTPIANASVLFSAAPGSAGFGACGGAATCIVKTNASGTVSTTVIGSAVGKVVLSASEVIGGAGVEVMVRDVNPVRAVTMTNAASYVAAGASEAWTISLNATQDGGAAAGAPVVWSAGSGVSLSGGATTTDADGSATVTVSGSHVSAGTVTVTGCVWVGVCKSWTLTAVDSSQWRIAVSGGAGQSVSAGTALAAVTMGVTDTAGHALEGATVSVYQTADGWEGTCTVPGRCASSPVLESKQSTVVSDTSGNVTVTPLEVQGLPQVVNIAAVTGTQGFVSLSLPVTP